MADLILRVESSSELDGIHHLIELAKNGVGSVHSQRSYETAIEEFINWSLHNGKIRINAAQLRAYQAHLTERHPPASAQTGCPWSLTYVNFPFLRRPR